jgi:hypothetical protein
MLTQVQHICKLHIMILPARGARLHTYCLALTKGTLICFLEMLAMIIPVGLVRQQQRLELLQVSSGPQAEAREDAGFQVSAGDRAFYAWPSLTFCHSGPIRTSKHSSAVFMAGLRYAIVMMWQSSNAL